VSGNVTDQDVNDTVGRLHDVVEISAQQRVLTARAVPGDNLNARVVEQQRGGQQAAFQQRVLAGPKLACVQVRGNKLDTFALDRIEQRTPQHLRFDTALDQIVLRAGRDCGSPEVFVVQSGQHNYGNGGIAFGDAVQSIHAVGVRQMQIQQYAIGPGGRKLALRMCHRLCPYHADIGDPVRDQVFHNHRVGSIVLDQQQRQRLPIRRRGYWTKHGHRSGTGAHRRSGNSPRTPWPR
jgi:hypothetical protein